MSVTAQTNLCNPTHVYNFVMFGIDMSDVPEIQLDELVHYCNANTYNLQRENISFSKDRPCVVCSQTGPSFDV